MEKDIDFTGNKKHLLINKAFEKKLRDSMTKEHYYLRNKLVSGELDHSKHMAMIRHNIATPLNAIQLDCLTILRATADPKLLRIHIAANQIKEILFSETKRVQTKIDLASVINECLLVHNTKGVEIDKKGLTKCKLNIDKGAFLQAVSCILQNAFEAIENTKKRTLRIKILEHAKKVCITIEDTGSGVSPDNKDKVFLMGFTTKPYNSGIGLYVARELVKNTLKGAIKIKNIRSGGCRVTIQLPKYEIYITIIQHGGLAER